MRVRETLVAMIALACAATASAQNPKVVGWRGDGTGVYPDATPPTEWYQKENGESKNILWKVKLPNYSFATPVIVGDKLFTRSEPYDLACLNKNTGKLLWLRSFPPFVAVTAEEKKANAGWKEVEALVAELQTLNGQFVAKGWSKDLYDRKHELTLNLNRLTAKVDPKYALPSDQYCEGWPGYAGATPCSDGALIYFTGSGGLTGCCDLDGRLKWATFNPFPAELNFEHGEGNSPALFKDWFLVPSGGKFYLFDKKTGKEFWRVPYPRATGGFAAAAPFTSGGHDYALLDGGFFSLKDGRQLGFQNYADLSAVIHGDTAYFMQMTARIGWRRFEGTPDGGLKITPGDNGNTWQIELPVAVPGDRWDVGKTAYTAAPLYVNGLFYAVGSWGNLVVADPAAAQVVYQKQLPFNMPLNRKTWGVGIGASPAFAGGRIYIVDSVGSTVVMEPGREYKQVAQNNIDYTVPEGWEVKHWTGPHHEQFEASPVFDGSRIYLRGEQFLYCIGEK